MDIIGENPELLKASVVIQVTDTEDQVFYSAKAGAKVGRILKSVGAKAGKSRITCHKCGRFFKTRKALGTHECIGEINDRL